MHELMCICTCRDSNLQKLMQIHVCLKFFEAIYIFLCFVHAFNIHCTQAYDTFPVFSSVLAMNFEVGGFGTVHVIKKHTLHVPCIYVHMCNISKLLLNKY